MMRLSLGIVVALLVIATTVALVAFNWTPNVPLDAASVPIAQTTVSDDASPDPTPDANGALAIPPPHGQDCLDRITRPEGWLDLCWSVVRAADGDVAKDYYTLRVYGTVSGSGSGIRWSRVRADLLGQPGDGVFESWPEGTTDGSCQSVDAPDPLTPSASAQEEICGRTIGAKIVGAWAQSATWTCVGCVLADHSERAVALYEWVGVPQGTVPTWSIGADFGG